MERQPASSPPGARSSGRRPPGKKPLIYLCGDPHGEFSHINRAVAGGRPVAVIILGDMQPPAPVEEILAETLRISQVWWIPGNHDSDTEEFYDRLWNGPLASHNLHGRVATVAGIRFAGLGGVFRGQIWMPDGEPNYRSAAAFTHRAGYRNQWRGGLPRRHRTSIFPATYDNLARMRADVLVTHEAAGCHRKGFAAIDRLAESLRVKKLFHGHQHEDRVYGSYRGMIVRGVGYRAIVDLDGHEIVPAQLDPRDQMALQSAGEEPPPEELDSLEFEPLFYPRSPRRRGGGRG